MLKKIELLANVAIIVVALLLGAVLVRRYLLPGSQAEPAAVEPQPQPGTKLPLADVDWAQGRRTLVLVLSKTCQFCTESAPFYRRLAQERAANENLRLLAVLPQEVGAGREYLDGLGLKVDDIRQAPPPTLGLRGTPALILADSTGNVLSSWVGKLPADKESEVLSALRAGAE